MTVQIISPLNHQIPILQRLWDDRSKGKTLIIIPSGAGKTHIAAFDALNMKAKSILYIAHRREILEQSASIFKNVHNLQDDQIGFINKDDKDFDRDFIFASNTALYKPDTIKMISDRLFDYMIIDEYHHVAAKTYQKILNKIAAKFVLGLTATPFRSDRKNIMKYVDNNISYNIDLEEGIIKKILVPFNYYGIYDDIDYSNIKWRGNNYSEGDLNRKLLIDQRDNLIIKKFNEHIGKGHTAIGFCVSVKHCERMDQKFRNSGIDSRHLTYKTPLEERRQIIIDFLNKRFDVLFVKDIFNEGLDFPRLEGLLFLRPTFSKTLFFQQLGRGLRHADGKTHVTVLDFIGNYHKAFLHQDWIYKITGKGEPREPDERPVFNCNINVNFDSVLIDIFKMQRRPELLKNPTKEALIKQYWEFKKILNRFPTYEDLRTKNSLKYGMIFSVSSYETLWGSWQKFLLDIQVIKKPTKQDLIENYYELKVRLGRRPTGRDMVLGVNQYGHGWVDVINAREKNRLSGRTRYSKNEYDNVFGSWQVFLKLIGDYDKEIPREELIRNYYNVKEKLGRRPKYKDFHNRNVSKYSSGPYEHKWGHFVDFLKDIGEVKKDCHPTMYYTKQDVLDNFAEVTKKLGRPPTREELWDKSLSKYSVFAIQYFWGTWGKFLQEMGLKIHQSVLEARNRKYTLPELKTMVKKLQEKLGRKRITNRDWSKEYGFMSKVVRMFGSWYKFQKEVGIYPKILNCVICHKPFTPTNYLHKICKAHSKSDIKKRAYATSKKAHQRNKELYKLHRQEKMLLK